MGLSLSKCKKPNGGGQTQVSNSPAAELSPELEGGAVYTTVDEPDFLRPYRDPESVNDNVDFPLDGRLLDSVSDEELLALFETAPRLHEFSATKIFCISKSLVLKGGPNVTASQARNMVFAAESLHLPVPKVHRSFTASVPGLYSDESEDYHFIVMDYIAGPTVEESWYSVEQDAREAATRQVADMIETMQSYRLDDLPPGPIDSPTEKCQGPWFTDYGAGPFATVQELQDWFNHKIDACIKVFQLPANYPRFHFRDLVFTHQDLATRNVVIDAVGKMVLSKLSDRHDELARRKAAIAYGLSTGRLL